MGNRDGEVCSECLLLPFCQSDLTVLLDSCWSSIDIHDNWVDVWEDRDGEVRWHEVSYNRLSKSVGNWDAMEPTEWEIAKDMQDIEEEDLYMLYS